MKKALSIIVLSFFVFAGYGSRHVYSQPKGEVTVEEAKAAQEIADKFLRRLDETGDIEPLIKEMYVGDFIPRYVKEQKRKLSSGSSGSIFYVSGLFYAPALLDQTNENDWQKLYLNTFNFMQHGYAVMFNKMAKSLLSGAKPKDDELENAFDTMYPEAVVRLLNGDPILRNFLERTDDASVDIKSVNDLRTVTRILTEANHLLRDRNYAGRSKMTPEAKKALILLKQKLPQDQLLRVLTTAHEAYGFPANTRFISIFASVTHNLILTKVNGEYKIVSATHSWLDD